MNSSGFVPDIGDPRLASAERAFVQNVDTGGFSAKGEAVYVVDDWAVVDCGLYLLCELVPEFFLHEEHQQVTRAWRVGDSILETGTLKVHFL